MKQISITISLFLCVTISYPQKIFFGKAAYSDSVLLKKNISSLAAQALALYKHPSPAIYYDNTFRLQLLAGLYKESNNSLEALCKQQMNDSLIHSALGFPYQLYTAILAAGTAPKDFETACTGFFYQRYNNYSKDNQVWVSQYFDNPVSVMRSQLMALTNEYKSLDSLGLQEAITLCRSYLSYTAYSAIAPVVKKILANIESDNFITADSVLIKMPDGGTISLAVVRDKKITAPQPVVMMYNIYAGREVAECKDAVSHGYVGIVANTRGKRLSPDAMEPFEHDAKDAYYIIDWISKQPWCNGKVGMYGGSYLGFSQWAAAKYMHPALKTIVPQVSVGAGLDFPKENGVFMSYALRWIHFVTDNKLTDLPGFTNEKKWNKVFEDWYKSGKSFRALDSTEGRPNAIFQRWLDHPGYDDYWQQMTPQKNEFAAINIPIFTTTGYWDDDQTGAMYYYKQYHQFNKNPNYYLLIGPYDHGGAQAYPKSTLNNYTIDSVANIPILDYVFQWFDHILKDSARPAFLKDKVNFEVMGKNEWRGVPSLDKMANDTLCLYLTPKMNDGHYSLSYIKPKQAAYISQVVDLKERNEPLFWGSETAMGAYPFIIDSVLHSEKEKLVFVSDPVEKPFAISGSLAASIVAGINKKDMDIVIDLFEQTPDGQYFALNQQVQRASYAKDRNKRQLLKPGKAETIPVSNTFITCKQLQKGSRIVIILGINKNPNWQINYGTGKDVSDETIRDAAVPLKIKWYNSSCIKLPVWR